MRLTQAQLVLLRLAESHALGTASPVFCLGLILVFTKDRFYAFMVFMNDQIIQTIQQKLGDFSEWFLGPNVEP